MTTNLTLIGQDRFCFYYTTPNRLKAVADLVLKEYRNDDGIARRILTTFTKYLVAREISNDIVEFFQQRIVALSEISTEDSLFYLGKTLLVRKVDQLPIECILSGDLVLFSNGTVIEFEEAVSILQKWLLNHKQYSINPGAFLETVKEKARRMSAIFKQYFELRSLKLLYFRMSLGIEIDEETKKPVPVWIGEGINPQTAIIFENGNLIEDSMYLANQILPKSVYKKEIGEFI
jgi:hypothetical protein